MSAVPEENHYDPINQLQTDGRGADPVPALMSLTVLTPIRHSYHLGRVTPLELKSRDKGKQRVLNLSFTDSGSSSPRAQKDAQSDSYFLPLPPSSDSSDVTPTAASLKSRPRPPARSPFRQTQQPSPRRHGTSDHPLPPAEPLPVIATDDAVPIPRHGRADTEAARARRREAYKSGMSFVSLYELYTEPPPALPIPPVPPLDRANLASTTGSIGRSRSRSGSTRERKNSLHGSTSTSNAPTINGHTRARSGSTGASPMSSANQLPKPSREPLPALTVEQSGSLGLANATISSSVPNLGEPPATRSKRQHVLFEILETERIYSSDMALVKAVHLPLALGLKVDFGPMGSVSASARSSTEHTPEPNGVSRSSGISTATASSSQSQSGSSGYPTTNGFVPPEPPMSVEDAKVIFANLDELAEFTGRFTEFIQLALGSEIDGGVGPDKIGGLFLEMVCCDVFSFLFFGC
jgi:hypothetical protein